MTRNPDHTLRTANGARGEHPCISQLADHSVIVRALTMHGPAVRQALDEMHRRGLWLTQEQCNDAEIREWELVV